VADLERFEGSCVHYWASPLEGKLCAGQEVALVGAGNSAGQATVYLAARVAKVWLLVRGRDLGASMSRYLVERIEGLANVEIITQAQITSLEGQPGQLEAVCWRLASGEEVRRPIHHLFLFVGAAPNTQWLDPSRVVLDPKGFILTGADVSPGRRHLETSLDGVFAVGDVRSGSVKRVAAAVGEGAQAVSALHAFLAKNTVLAKARGAIPQPVSAVSAIPDESPQFLDNRNLGVRGRRAHDDALGGPS
jgi:thioredoxin reductase (NADPH)